MADESLGQGLRKSVGFRAMRADTKQVGQPLSCSRAGARPGDDAHAPPRTEAGKGGGAEAGGRGENGGGGSCGERDWGEQRDGGGCSR